MDKITQRMRNPNFKKKKASDNMTIDEYVKLALAKSNMPSLKEMFTTFDKNSKF